MAPAEAAPTLRRDARENRDRIVNAARELFAARGIHVTLNEVAHYAGVGVGTVYRRFPDKDLLIAEVFESRLAEVAALLKAAAADPDPWRGLTAFVYGSLELQVTDRALSDLILGAPTAVHRLADLRAELVPIAADLIEQARTAGEVRPDFDVSDLPVLLMMIRTAVDLTRDTAPEAWRRFAQLALQGIRPSDREVEPFTVAPIGAEHINEVAERWRPPRF